MICYTFSDRRELWESCKPKKYMSFPISGRFMAYSRFEAIRRHVRFSFQPESEIDNKALGARWKLVEDFADTINKHREELFKPEEFICVDESISRWYRIGRKWLGVGFPTYISMNRNSDNVCEIQSSGGGRSGIILRMRVVKYSDEDGSAATSTMPRDQRKHWNCCIYGLRMTKIFALTATLHSLRLREVCTRTELASQGLLRIARKVSDDSIE